LGDGEENRSELDVYTIAISYAKYAYKSMKSFAPLNSSKDVREAFNNNNV